MKDALLGFLRAARIAGVTVSVAESIDVFRTVELVGFDDRNALKDALGLILAKTTDEADRFSLVFDRYFGGDGTDLFVLTESDDDAAASFDLTELEADLLDSELARILLEDDRARLVRDLYAAAREERVSEVRFATQINQVARRILDRLGLEGLDAAIARLRASGNVRRAAAADFLERRRAAVAQMARDIVERRFAAANGGASGVRNDEFLREARFSNVDRRDAERMRMLVRETARKFATRFGRTRKRALRGKLDVRRTLRAAVATENIPFRVRWRSQKIAKPKLLLLCDVSGSVSALAGFFLLFIHELHDAVSDVRAFAFAGRAIDIGDVLKKRSIDELGAHVMREIGFQSSDYGRAFGEIEDAGAIEAVDRKTTVIVIGDGRTNYGDPRADVVQRMYERAKRVVWLNPEHRGTWGTDDSEMLRYATYTSHARTCNRLRHLESFVEDLLEDRIGSSA